MKEAYYKRLTLQEEGGEFDGGVYKEGCGFKVKEHLAWSLSSLLASLGEEDDHRVFCEGKKMAELASSGRGSGD